MGLYNFQPQFRTPIENGTKIGTIRAPRGGREDLPGDRMHLYTGLRHESAARIYPLCVRRENTGKPRFLRVSLQGKKAVIDSRLVPVCQSVQTIVLREWEERFEIWIGRPIWLDPEDERGHQEMDLLITTAAGPKALKLDLLTLKESVNVARGDGFPNLLAMATYWRKNGKNAMPFWGYWRIWCHECEYFTNTVLLARQPADAGRRKPLVELPQCGGGK